MSLNNKSDNNKIKIGLYIVSTPIGNLLDVSQRAIETLRKSDFILCEDTRVSKILLKKFDIKSNLISYHKFNEKKNLNKIIKLLKSGSLISLISDAGTPSISDPGCVLINECLKNDINVSPVPGPSAVSSAVSVSGFSDKFYFYGFLPEKKKLLNSDLLTLSKLNCSIVFFISSKKFNKTIPILKKYFNGRKILICKEMTKFYEEFFYHFYLNSQEMKKVKNVSQKLSESDKNLIRKTINKLSIKEIVNLINKNNEISKKEIYNYCLELKNED